VRAAFVARGSRAAALGACFGLAACELVFPTRVSVPPDASGPDSRAPGDAPGTPTYNEVTNPAYWSSFDVSTAGISGGFAGAAFDGHYVYFVPQYDMTVARNDTTAPWQAPSSWAGFDTTTLGSAVQGFAGGAFDHRYVYFVPAAHVIARCDSNDAFQDGGSWSTFDLASLDSHQGYAGAAFDGHYLYLSPFFDPATNASNSTVRQFDTTAPLDAGASWASFDTTTVDPHAFSFYGAVFDGQYVYFVPYGGTNVARYDTTAPFGGASSWVTFNPSVVDPDAMNFNGGAFDGRYVYFVPYGTGASGSVVARYDTMASFAEPTSWTTFHAESLGAQGFGAVGFDGRYLYFAPLSGGVLARYDTTASFSSAASWTSFDTTSVGNGGPIRGVAFDGRYLYFVPGAGAALRFDAKTPASIPPGYSGSFF
jgi:hypothetical protein